jgi:hypothetical protein
MLLLPFRQIRNPGFQIAHFAKRFWVGSTVANCVFTCEVMSAAAHSTSRESGSNSSAPACTEYRWLAGWAVAGRIPRVFHGLRRWAARCSTNPSGQHYGRADFRGRHSN